MDKSKTTVLTYSTVTSELKCGISGPMDRLDGPVSGRKSFGMWIQKYRVS